MLRKLLLYVLPFLLPLVAYGVWLAFARRKARLAGSGALPRWQEAPWTWLLIAGFGLLILGFASLALFGNGAPGGRYVPPQVIDGEIVPGRFE
ncbi:MAG: DUF6111 family protein [Alphaproteobacteria bacterium]